MIIKRSVLTPAEQARLENSEAQAQTNAANIDYLAMMTDVEIPTEEGAENESEI
jgi:hypothetical protein